ncbi:MobA/MobL family protein [Escherichia coli]
MERPTHAETWRASWADHANRALANAGYQEEIDHRSYERQGLEKTPGIHLGKSACDGNTRYRNRTRRTESSD